MTEGERIKRIYENLEELRYNDMILPEYFDDMAFLLKSFYRKKEYERTLESVQEELWYALHSNKDEGMRWFYVENAERLIKEALHDE